MKKNVHGIDLFSASSSSVKPSFYELVELVQYYGSKNAGAKKIVVTSHASTKNNILLIASRKCVPTSHSSVGVLFNFVLIFSRPVIIGR